MSRCLAVITQAAFFSVIAATTFAEEQWDWLNLDDINVSCVTVAPGDSSLIVVGGAQLNVSHDGGLTWVGNSEVSTVRCIAFGSSRNLAFASTWGRGIYRSTDGCVTWTPSNNGLTNGVIKSVCVSPVDDQIVLAAAEDGLLRSIDGGLHWTMIQPGLNASALAISPLRPKSCTWAPGDGGRGDPTMREPPGRASEPAYCLTAGSATRSPWTRPTTVSSTPFSRAAGCGRRSTTAGAWRHLEPGFEGFAVAPDMHRPGFIYGLGGWTYPQRSGCYGGAAGWTGMNTNWNPAWFARYIAVDPNDSTRVYACGSGGLYRWIADVTPPGPPGHTHGVVRRQCDSVVLGSERLRGLHRLLGLQETRGGVVSPGPFVRDQRPRDYLAFGHKRDGRPRLLLSRRGHRLGAERQCAVERGRIPGLGHLRPRRGLHRPAAARLPFLFARIPGQHPHAQSRYGSR